LAAAIVTVGALPDALQLCEISTALTDRRIDGSTDRRIDVSNVRSLLTANSYA